MSYETELNELKQQEKSAWDDYTESMANKEHLYITDAKLGRAFKLQGQRQVMERSKPEFKLPKITLKRAVVESIVAGLVTLLLFAGLGGIVYIVVKNTPDFLVQHCTAIFQGLGTVLGTFLGGALLRRMKSIRRVLHKVTCKTLFHETD